MASHSGLLAGLLAAYLLVMLSIGVWAKGQIHTSEDYLVAGRKLPLGLAWPTLVATWFGAGTLLTATDEVRHGGLRMAALDPLGAGFCLALAGWWLARPLWNMRLLTLGDFFRIRFGVRTEVCASLMMVPTYFGWIAAQFVALAELFALLFGGPTSLWIAAIAAVGTTYTLLGGMWSVTVTDVVQMAFVVIGLLVLAYEILVALGGSIGGGFEALLVGLPPEKLVIVPTASASDFVGWLGVLAVGSLGNLPGQDLFQRVFASRSAETAVRACHLSSVTYLGLGLVPLLIGLSADLLVPGNSGRSTLALLSTIFLSPWSGSLLLLAVVSAVFSTIDSAILSPASLLSENVLPKILSPKILSPKISSLRLNRYAVLGVAALATATAYLGESAYSMLEDAYALAMVSLLVPLLAGVWSVRGGEGAALASMSTGLILWLVHEGMHWDSFVAPLLPANGMNVPVAPVCTILAAVAFMLVRALERPRPMQERVDLNRC